MTKQLRNKTVCPHCGHEFDTTTPFSQWVRGLPPPLHSGNFDYQNLDGIWNSYRDGWYITLEEKRYGAQSDERSQRDTHNMIRQMLTIASQSVVLTLRGKRPYAYRGHYEVSFEKTSPEDSAWVKINNTQYDKPIEAVKSLLSTGRVGITQLEDMGVIPDIRGLEWLNSLPIERLPGLLRWLGERLDTLLKSKDKAA